MIDMTDCLMTNDADINEDNPTSTRRGNSVISVSILAYFPSLWGMEYNGSRLGKKVVLGLCDKNSFASRPILVLTHTRHLTSRA